MFTFNMPNLKSIMNTVLKTFAYIDKRLHIIKGNKIIYYAFTHISRAIDL